MNENLGLILQWLYPGRANVGYMVESVDGLSTIAFWDAAVMGEPQPTEAEVMAREADWQAAMDTPEARLDRLNLSKRDRALMAVILRAHSNWLTFPLARRQKIQEIIDAVGDRIIDALT